MRRHYSITYKQSFHEINDLIAVVRAENLLCGHTLYQKYSDPPLEPNSGYATASEMSRHVKQDTEVCGIIKPGMCLDAITVSAKEKIRQMTKKDVVVIWGGTNDVGKNNEECGQRHLQAFVE